MKFTFNKKARAIALNAIKRLENGAFASSILGAFSANPKATAISSLLLFLVCRLGETVIAGIEDEPQGRADDAKAANPKEESDRADSG